MFNPVDYAEIIRRKIVRDSTRKYYRLSRKGKWYGGIATSDCLGCNLKCVFCWSGFPRDHLEKFNKFYEPEEVANSLISCAQKYGYSQIRISGNEPTMGKEHLLKILEIIDKTPYQFILETNGTLINKEYAKDLSQFTNLKVRVSLKGTNCLEFSRLTGADSEGFNLQLEALRNLFAFKVDCWPAVMLSFSTDKNFRKLEERIEKINPIVVEKIEREYVFLYPSVRKRLAEARIKILKSYRPSGIPSELI